MTVQEIEELYPQFYDWLHKVKGYATASGVYLIKLWYEFLQAKKKQ